MRKKVTRRIPRASSFPFPLLTVGCAAGARCAGSRCVWVSLPAPLKGLPFGAPCANIACWSNASCDPRASCRRSVRNCIVKPGLTHPNVAGDPFAACALLPLCCCCCSICQTVTLPMARAMSARASVSVRKVRSQTARVHRSTRTGEGAGGSAGGTDKQPAPFGCTVTYQS